MKCFQAVVIISVGCQRQFISIIHLNKEKVSISQLSDLFCKE